MSRQGFSIKKHDTISRTTQKSLLDVPRQTAQDKRKERWRHVNHTLNAITTKLPLDKDLANESDKLDAVTIVSSKNLKPGRQTRLAPMSRVSASTSKGFPAAIIPSTTAADSQRYSSMAASPRLQQNEGTPRAQTKPHQVQPLWSPQQKRDFEKSQFNPEREQRLQQQSFRIKSPQIVIETHDEQLSTKQGSNRDTPKSNLISIEAVDQTFLDVVMKEEARRASRQYQHAANHGNEDLCRIEFDPDTANTSRLNDASKPQTGFVSAAQNTRNNMPQQNYATQIASTNVRRIVPRHATRMEPNSKFKTHVEQFEKQLNNSVDHTSQPICLNNYYKKMDMPLRPAICSPNQAGRKLIMSMPRNAEQSYKQMVSTEMLQDDSLCMSATKIAQNEHKQQQTLSNGSTMFKLRNPQGMPESIRQQSFKVRQPAPLQNAKLLPEQPKNFSSNTVDFTKKVQKSLSPVLQPVDDSAEKLEVFREFASHLNGGLNVHVDDQQTAQRRANFSTIQQSPTSKLNIAAPVSQHMKLRLQMMKFKQRQKEVANALTSVSNTPLTESTAQVVVDTTKSSMTSCDPRTNQFLQTQIQLRKSLCSPQERMRQSLNLTPNMAFKKQKAVGLHGLTPKQEALKINLAGIRKAVRATLERSGMDVEVPRINTALIKQRSSQSPKRAQLPELSPPRALEQEAPPVAVARSPVSFSLDLTLRQEIIDEQTMEAVTKRAQEALKNRDSADSPDNFAQRKQQDDDVGPTSPITPRMRKMIKKQVKADTSAVAKARRASILFKQKKIQVDRPERQIFKPLYKDDDEENGGEKKRKRLPRCKLLELLAKLDEFMRSRNFKVKNEWLEDIEDRYIKATPQGLSLAIEEAILKTMTGADEAEKRRKASIIAIAAREVKDQKIQVLKDSFALLEMQCMFQERQFREQVLNAEPKTRAYFNALMSKLDSHVAKLKTQTQRAQNLIIRHPTNSFDVTKLFEMRFTNIFNPGQQTMVVGVHKYGPLATTLLNRLRRALKVCVIRQMRLDERDKIMQPRIIKGRYKKLRERYEANLQNALKATETSIDSSESVSVSSCETLESPQRTAQRNDSISSSFGNYSFKVRRYENPTKRFRNLVMKHFMSKSTTVQKLQELDRRAITFRVMFDLLNFKTVLQKLLPSGEYNTMGARYVQIGHNQFKNDYLREIIEKKSVYNDYLRVYEGDNDIRTNKIPAVGEAHNREDEEDLNRVFSKQTVRKCFYELVKKQHIAEEDQEDNQMRTFMDFFDACGRGAGTVVNPRDINFWNRCQYLFNSKMDLKRAKALSKFLLLAKEHEPALLREIVVDSCAMTDDVFAELLAGATNQVKYVVTPGCDKPPQRRQFLYTIVYSNNQFGPLALKQLQNVSSDLIDVRLNNCQVLGHRSTLTELNEHLALRDTSPYLMKLALTNLDLSSDMVFESILEVLASKKHLQYVDVSWGTLGPRQLQRLSKQFNTMTKQLRDINLSYNRLDFEEDGAREQSLLFVKQFSTLIKDGRILNHINLSGMNIPADIILELCEVMNASPLLMGIHLNDLGINDSIQMLQQVLDKFELTLDDVPRRRLNLIDASYVQLEQEEKKYETKRDSVDIKRRVQQYMRFSCPDKEVQGIQRALIKMSTKKTPCIDHQERLLDKAVQQKRLHMRENLLLGKEFRNYENLKALNSSKCKQGIGRLEDGGSDKFMVNRVLNHPELIFNQQPKYDHDMQQRYFRRDAKHDWEFSPTNDCFICNRHQYTQIHYERGVLATNKELVEIKDPLLLKELRYQYEKEFLNNRTETPIICGTIVNRRATQDVFDRKLKMVRTPLYCLLAICQTREFFPDQKLVHGLKEGVQLFLKNDNWELLDHLRIKNKFSGWSHVLNDMALHNELTDVRAINRPEVSAYNVEVKDWFTFAGFFTPGYHQVLIYDPKIDRAYAQDFVVKLNQRDFVYPEYPVHLEMHMQEKIPSVWKNFREDTPQDLEACVLNEFCRTSFAGHRLRTKVIKDEEDMNMVLEILTQNFERVMLYQKHLLSAIDPKYPEPSLEIVMEAIETVQQREEFPGTPLQRAQVQLSFQAATYQEGMSALKGAMDRAELLNFIIRVALQWVRLDKSTKEKLSTWLLQFMKTYIDPIIEKSHIIEVRKTIRSSRRLNELLHRNARSLTKIFESAPRDLDHGNSKFTINTAVAMFMPLVQSSYLMNINSRTIDRCFVASLMTIYDEQKKSAKYHYLVYVEFLELLCRVAHAGSDPESMEPIAFKVQDMLEGLWYQFIKTGVLDEEEDKLITVNLGFFT